MIGFYLLVSIFTQLSPYGVVGTSELATQQAKAHHGVNAHQNAAASNQIPSSQLIVDFPQINGLKPGSPVLVEGNLVGRVKRISSKQGARNQAKSPRSFEVALDLDSAVFQKLSLGTCALQAMPMTDAKETRKPVVELFVPKEIGKPSANSKLSMLRPGDRIPGYASYEEFWRSGTEKKSKNG